MSNFPRNTNSNETIFIGNAIDYTYSLDDQCRMEFGEGFAFCSTFEVKQDLKGTQSLALLPCQILLVRIWNSVFYVGFYKIAA